MAEMQRFVTFELQDVIDFIEKEENVFLLLACIWKAFPNKKTVVMVFMINRKIHDRFELWNLSSCVQI